MLYTKYLSESLSSEKSINDSLDALLLDNDKVCIKAPTGTGKTTLIFSRMQREASNGFLSILALPYRSIIENKTEKAKDYGIISGFGSDVKHIDFSSGGRAIQTTYEGAMLILKSTNRTDVKLYVDEAHVLIENSGIRNSCSEILDEDCKIVGMTATPLHIEDIGFTIYEPKRAIETPRINVKALISSKSTSSIVYDIISKHNKENSVLQIRINNKKEIDKACDTAEAKGLKYVAIYTNGKSGIEAIHKHNGLNEAEVLDAQKGIFSENIDLILNTSKLDCGLDFEPDKNFNIWNLDINFELWFAPGSNMVFLYRNQLFTNDNVTDLDYFASLSNLFDQPTQHQFSIRINYLIDYNRIRGNR